jgi:hypothetical protein
MTRARDKSHLRIRKIQFIGQSSPIAFVCVQTWSPKYPNNYARKRDETRPGDWPQHPTPTCHMIRTRANRTCPDFGGDTSNPKAVDIKPGVRPYAADP